MCVDVNKYLSVSINIYIENETSERMKFKGAFVVRITNNYEINKKLTLHKFSVRGISVRSTSIEHIDECGNHNSGRNDANGIRVYES